MLVVHDKCTFLRSLDLFAHVSDATLEQIMAGMDEVTSAAMNVCFMKARRAMRCI